MTVRRWVVVLACCAVVFGAACGGGDDQTDIEDEGAPEGASNAVEVSAANFAFSPPSVPVEPGAEIELTFTNEDTTQHSFTADDLGIDLVLDGGASDSTTFTAPDSGSVEFQCKFHQSMIGTITTDGSAAGSSGSDDQDLDY
jgi:plastocyanin